MGEEKATICWKDPPWNVNMGSGDTHLYSKRNRTIINDNLGDEFGAFAEKFCQGIYAALVPGGMLYMAMSAQEWDYHLQRQQWQEYKPKAWEHNYKMYYHK